MPVDDLIRADLPSPAANTLPSQKEIEAMGRRRYQNPKPHREGMWWYLRVWQDGFAEGKPVRKLKRIKLGPASMKERQVRKLADEIIRPVNQGLVTIGSAVNFAEYVKDTYLPTVLRMRPRTVQNSYKGMIKNHLNPAFGNKMLGDLSVQTVQAFFAAMPERGVSYPVAVKVRDALSSVVRSAIRFKYLTANPMDGLELPTDMRGKRVKPFVYPYQFEAILDLMPEPYATMIYVGVWTGLRISELCALKWQDIHSDSISIERKYCRGEWGPTKTDGSSATISVDNAVLGRIQRMKGLTVELNWGGRGARKVLQVVKASGPDDLVFQSLRDGKPMNDGNILRRFIKPAAEKLNIEHVNWRCLRTSCATWMVRAGADPKSVQGQMRHSRISTTMDIYAQCVPEGQRRAVEQMNEYARKSVLEAGTKSVTVSVQ